jgi:hypothetical protein
MLTPRQLAKTRRTSEGHLLWDGGLANKYPAIKHLGKTVYLKRLIWEEANGPIPDGAVVISTCGERTCVDLSHLGLSTSGRYASARDALGKFTEKREFQVSSTLIE